MSLRKVVVDCSAAVPWFFPEEADISVSLLFKQMRQKRVACIAPSLLITEFGNTAWKKVRRGVCSENFAVTQFACFKKLPINFLDAGVLATSALQFAVKHSITVYDSLYICCALFMQAELATQDSLLAETACRCGIAVFA